MTPDRPTPFDVIFHVIKSILSGIGAVSVIVFLSYLYHR